MGLKTSSVSKCLDKKLQIMGYEVPDLLLIFLCLSILNLLFSSTNRKLILIWLPTIVLALVLRIGKRGKPENYLVHLFKYHTQPKHYVAFHASTDTPTLRKKHYAK